MVRDEINTNLSIKHKHTRSRIRLRPDADVVVRDDVELLVGPTGGHGWRGHVLAFIVVAIGVAMWFVYIYILGVCILGDETGGLVVIVGLGARRGTHLYMLLMCR